LCERANVAGVLLTGGNDLAALGGDAPERDAVESALLEFAEQRGLPVLGVCRGMQVIQNRFGVALCPVEGHVAHKQVVCIDGVPREVNSFHHYAAFESHPSLEPWAVAEDGVVKAIRHTNQPITGIMWHPERIAPFSLADLQLVRSIFGVEECTR
jgi:gamma-glutamyl-gamma-aminobutyrate hydrolase PuuD